MIEEEDNEKEVLDVINKATYGNCDINSEFDATTSTQSGGELKKIAFARALYHKKKHPIMVMDEIIIIEDGSVVYSGCSILVPSIYV